MQKLSRVIGVVALAGSLCCGGCAGPREQGGPAQQKNAAETRNEEILRRWIDEAINKGQVDVLDELAASDYVYHGPGQEIHGVAEFKQLLSGFLTAFPDLHCTIEDLVVEDEKAAGRYTLTGTHQGEFAGLAPTGKRLTLNMITFTRFENGKAVEDWEVYDVQSMMAQLSSKE